MIRLDKKNVKQTGVTELVLKTRRSSDHSISRIFSHSRRFWPDSLLPTYIKVEESYFRKFKVALNPLRRMFLNFAKGCIL